MTNKTTNNKQQHNSFTTNKTTIAKRIVELYNQQMNGKWDTIMYNEIPFDHVTYEEDLEYYCQELREKIL